MQRLGMREVREMLRDGHVERLCRELCPGGRREGEYWVAPNPTRDDRHRGSFKIWLRGPKRGGFVDYATDDRGDVLDLIAYVRHLDRAEALRWAKDWLGIRAMSDADRARLAGRAKHAEARTRAAEAEEAARRQRRAFELWLTAKIIELDPHPTSPLQGEGNPAAPALLYFAGRNCPLDQVPHLSRDSLRFRPALEWWKGRDRETGEPGPSFPAIVSALRGREGNVTGVHCTFIAEASTPSRPPPFRGRGKAAWVKAPVSNPKLMFGTSRGSVIRISDGPSGLPPDEARGKPSPLVIAEGIEDALTIAIAIPEARVWAAGSLGNIGEAPADLDCVATVIVAGDRDWSKPQAMAALDRALDQLAAHGKPVEVITSIVGKDFNDLAREWA